jgi:hypothetical protein
METDEEQISILRNMASMLHSVYYGTLSALMKDSSLFEVYEIAIKGIEDMLGGYFKHIEEMGLQDIFLRLERTGLYSNLGVETVGDGSFVFKIGDCKFAGGDGGIHKSVSGIDMPCPLALFVGAHLRKGSPTNRVYIYPTVYEDESSRTQIDLISEGEYRVRMKRLKSMP